jgi:hypothetical protein
MPRASCIEHPKRSRFVVLWDHYLDIFERNQCAGVLLSTFEYLTNGELERLEESGPGQPHPQAWIACDMEQLRLGALSLYTSRTIQDAIQKLETAGFLTVERRALGKKNRYLFHPERVQEAIAKRLVFDGSLDGKISVEIAAVDGSPDGSADGSPDGKISVDHLITYKEQEQEQCLHALHCERASDENEKTYFEESPEPSGEDYEITPQATGYPKKTVDIKAKDIQAIWRGRTGKKLSLTAKAKPWPWLLKRTAGLVGAVGMEEFTTREAAYLERQAKGEGDYREFLDSFSTYRNGDKSTAPSASTGRPAANGPVPDSPHPLNQPSASEAPKPADRAPREALLWNEQVPGCKWEIWDRWLDEALKAKLQEPLFLESYPRLLVKCQEIVAAGHPKAGFFSIGWVLKDRNWVKILNGEHNWLLHDSDAPRMPTDEEKNPALRLLAKLRAERIAKEANGTH